MSVFGLEGIEIIVLRPVNDQPTLWDSVQPAELARVDGLFDDERFFASFAPFFDPVIPANVACPTHSGLLAKAVGKWPARSAE